MSLDDIDDQDMTTYKVVVNAEEQFSIWPAGRDNPLGWKDVGKRGTKRECVDYIKTLWSDPQPYYEKANEQKQERS